MLTMSDKGDRGGMGNDELAEEGVGGGLDPQVLADIICKRPLMSFFSLILGRNLFPV